MRRFLFLAFCLICALKIGAQVYDSSNSLERKALLIYELGEDGFYHKKENVNLDKVNLVMAKYGYNKKTHELYVETSWANCIITVDDNTHKTIKKNKSIPQLKPEELTTLANVVSQKVEDKYERLNTDRRKRIEEAREQARIDSIQRAIADSLRIAVENKKESDYRKCHHWDRVPTKKKDMYCIICEKSVDTNDSIICYALRNDTIYWGEIKEGMRGYFYHQTHVAEIPLSIKKDKDFQYHYKVFKDSLETPPQAMNLLIALKGNLEDLSKYLKILRESAPNGFFLDWNWDSEYSNITFSFTYQNTNKNTIKYIEVFFVVTNDVGDVRKTGSFKGTGPVEPWESASWNWDHSSYYVAGDASKMSLSKVIITYMNGTKVTIPKHKICYNWD